MLDRRVTLGPVEESPQPDLVATVEEKKKLKDLKKKSWAEARKLKELKQVGKETGPTRASFTRKRGIFWGLHRGV